MKDNVIKEDFENEEKCALDTTDLCIEKLESLGAYSKDFAKGLNVGFNYALAMIREELGEDYWEGKQTNIAMVQYYSSLMWGKNRKYI